MITSSKISHSLGFQRKLIVVAMVIIVQFLVFPIQGVKAENQEAEPTPYKNAAIGASALVLQPVYLAVKLAIGATGTILSGAALVATGGNEKLAKEIFDNSWAGPWGVPELFKPTQMEPSKN